MSVQVAGDGTVILAGKDITLPAILAHLEAGLTVVIAPEDQEDMPEPRTLSM